MQLKSSRGATQGPTHPPTQHTHKHTQKRRTRKQTPSTSPEQTPGTHKHTRTHTPHPPKTQWQPTALRRQAAIRSATLRAPGDARPSESANPQGVTRPKAPKPRQDPQGPNPRRQPKRPARDQASHQANQPARQARKEGPERIRTKLWHFICVYFDYNLPMPWLSESSCLSDVCFS